MSAEVADLLEWRTFETGSAPPRGARSDRSRHAMAGGRKYRLYNNNWSDGDVRTPAPLRAPTLGRALVLAHGHVRAADAQAGLHVGVVAYAILAEPSAPLVSGESIGPRSPWRSPQKDLMAWRDATPTHPWRAAIVDAPRHTPSSEWAQRRRATAKRGPRRMGGEGSGPVRCPLRVGPRDIASGYDLPGSRERPRERAAWGPPIGPSQSTQANRFDCGTGTSLAC